ncbi:hypothetical protein ACFWNN_39475 [Lentzea sp. NPDC058450]|uniref:hypothetical protein n=1 Tax=Lentzea sp. NPDC058450 TaxID=3346505 RepID=UPI003663B6D5
MKRLVPLLVVTLAACSTTPPAVPSSSTTQAPAPTTTSPKPDQTYAIHDVFFQFTNALSEKNGDAALAAVASKAVATWESYRVHALKSTESQLAALPIGERSVVYGLRAAVDPAVLRTRTGREVLVTAVQQGLVSMNTSTRVGYADGTTTVDESLPDLTRLILGADVSTGEMAPGNPDAPAPSPPLTVRFVREGEDWKVDLAVLTEWTTAGLEKLATQRGTTADQVLTDLFAARFGAARAAELRKPLEG